MKLIRLVVLVVLLTCVLGAQTVQQATQMLNAATVAGSAATTGAVITFTVPASQFFYLTGLDISNCAGSSAVTAASVTSLTSVGFGGITPVWTIGSGTVAGTCTNWSIAFSTPLKSASAGTNVTFTLPTFATNQTIRVNAYGFYGF